MIVRMEPRISKRLLLLITRAEEEKRVDRAMERLQLPIFYQLRGQGTAPSELLDLCGLQGTSRTVTLSILPQDLVGCVFQILTQDLLLQRRGGGIAVTVPITGMQDMIRKMLEERGSYAFPDTRKGAQTPMTPKETAYSMILVAANYGYSDEVIDAARSAGARGGTVIRGRRRGSENVLNFLGVSAQEEQEFTMIIVPQEKKSAVMVAVSRTCGLTTPAHGVVLAVPVEEVLGLETDR